MKLNQPLIDGHSKGLFVIAATPFTEQGALDLDSTDRMIDFYLEHGAAGLTVLGMMGEAAKLTQEEGSLFLNRVLKRTGGRIPVVVGVSNAGTDNLVTFSHDCMQAGAAGVMITPLSTLRNEEQVVNYFVEIGTRLDSQVPIVLQDFPQVTGVVMSVPTIERIFSNVSQVVSFKHEDCPGLTKLSALRAQDAKRRRISILVGNSGLFLPQEMARGADGAMTGFAYPEMLAQVCAAYAKGEPQKGEDLFDAYLPLVRYESQPGLGLAIRKEVLRRRGAIACAHVRAPGPKLSALDHQEITSLMQRLDIRLGK